jgi:hypothetical protein
MLHRTTASLRSGHPALSFGRLGGASELQEWQMKKVLSFSINLFGWHMTVEVKRRSIV